MRISSAKNTKSGPPSTPYGWVSSGPIFDCGGCGERCGLCKYKVNAMREEKWLLDTTKKLEKKIDHEKIDEKKKEQDKNIT